LLDHLAEPAGYVPIDIAGRALAQAAHDLAACYPSLEVMPVCADFTRTLRLPESRNPAARRVVYFPGSTVGNFGPRSARALLRQIRRLCGPGGGFLVGIDLKKDPHLLERAYDDGQGVTGAFNLNLLRRINRELGANFRLDRFRHRAFYNADRGRIEMHLVSLGPQSVRIGAARVAFAEGESIRTECSYKYTVEEFQDLAAAAGLEGQEVWTDERRLFGVLYFGVR
jgi:dimethylhistidine N-methyltransferase